MFDNPGNKLRTFAIVNFEVGLVAALILAYRLWGTSHMLAIGVALLGFLIFYTVSLIACVFADIEVNTRNIEMKTQDVEHAVAKVGDRVLEIIARTEQVVE